MIGDEDRRNGGLRHRLAAAIRRRNAGARPLPLDNLALAHFGEELNPREPVLPVEPPAGFFVAEILDTLRQHPAGLTVDELCELLDRPERGHGGGVRQTLGNLRNKFFQPILNEGGVFRLLRPGEY
ncbi:hypothetical protein [Pseudomonas aeruginosa]|uniref:hypothetical protein n=1 Tax=Pseudomonas aeruginosa TaxID=287 RepID=UPI000C2C4AF7|nr:hypothetical protein [Pseudomonas aeruginosa]AUA83262.1 hypothetical protein CWI22_13045 [Pseudomonas aeruginosa]AUA89345.1 hypothetical protein CWI23_13045 [Pseudomonas aeruginosa]